MSDAPGTTGISFESLRQRDIRLAFFDIDGTLLGREGHYSERVRQAIAAVRAQGIRTAVASGRPKFAAQFLIDELQLVDAGLFYTGALIYDPSVSTRIALHALNDDLVSRLLSAATGMGLHTEIYTEHEFYMRQLTPLGVSHCEHLRVQPVECRLEDLVGREPVIKMLFAADNRADQDKLFALADGFPEVIFACAHLVSEPDWLFCSAISEVACKTIGFNQLLEYHGVSAAQVVAFGDAQSDMTFLSLAGLGVAMGNASDEVKAIADFVTAPVWEDGVALVLEQLVN